MLEDDITKPLTYIGHVDNLPPLTANNGDICEMNGTLYIYNDLNSTWYRMERVVNKFFNGTYELNI